MPPRSRLENFAPGSNTLILLFVTSATPVFPGGVAGTPTVTGNGLAWVRAQSVLYGANGDRRLTCFRASGAAPSDGAAVIDFGSETQDFCAWSVFEYSDVDVSGAQGEAAIAQVFAVTATGQSLTASLAPSADPNRNFAVGAIAIESALGAVIGVSPAPASPEIDEQDVSTGFPGQGRHVADRGRCGVEYARSPGRGTPPSPPRPSFWRSRPLRRPTRAGTTPAPADDGALVNRFEPVLFFHPLEKFFPSDAKRYIEHAALWTAQDADDDRERVGRPARRPLSAQPHCSGHGSGGCSQRARRLPLRRGTRRRKRSQVSYELGGWNDPSLMHEPGVTAQSSNRFSDRNEIAKAYTTIPELEKSRFWYHAEVIHEEQLRTIGRDTPGVDLSKVLSRLRNPTLVCYYLFFPAHDQSVGSGQCTNLEASEVSSHAGTGNASRFSARAPPTLLSRNSWAAPALVPAGPTIRRTNSTTTASPR